MLGKTLAHYQITAKLGEGGMGEVYRAEDSKLGREVAIKVLPEAVASDPERLARFEREAKMLASLNHPNIAGIHQVEHADGVFFLVMELIEGETLGQRLKREPMTVTEALESHLPRGSRLYRWQPGDAGCGAGGRDLDLAATGCAGD